MNRDPENPDGAIHKKVYITKCALTHGIAEKEVKIVNGYAYSKGQYSTQYCPGEFFDSQQEALNAAEEMRVKKIASLKKQITKLNAMRFRMASNQEQAP